MRIINDALVWQQVMFKTREIFETKLNLNQTRFDECYNRVKHDGYTDEQFKFFCDCVDYNYSRKRDIITLSFDTLEKFCEHLIGTFHKSWISSGFGADFVGTAFLNILETQQRGALGVKLVELSNGMYIWVCSEITNENHRTTVQIFIGINNLNWL